MRRSPGLRFRVAAPSQISMLRLPMLPALNAEVPGRLGVTAS